MIRRSGSPVEPNRRCSSPFLNYLPVCAPPATPATRPPHTHSPSPPPLSPVLSFCHVRSAHTCVAVWTVWGGGLCLQTAHHRHVREECYVIVYTPRTHLTTGRDMKHDRYDRPLSHRLSQTKATRSVRIFKLRPPPLPVVVSVVVLPSAR